MFLSSGIAGKTVRTQDQIIATAEILRHKYGFKGYLHLKLMPGAERAQIERTMQLADRVSLNLEAPNSQRLQRLAPAKMFMEELIAPLLTAEDIRRTQPAQLNWKGRWPSMSTQFVMGAVGENDLEMLTTTEDLYRRIRLGRAYYSAFRPIQGTPFEDLPPAPLTRQNRLYQASFLLRDYGFDLEELPFEGDGNLPQDTDPKNAWARQHLNGTPIEINRAERRELLRLPGIGPKGADAILAARRKSALRSVEDVRRLGVNISRALPFVLFDGKQAERQLAFSF
jgi:predicted DNA-binding helix-hairpin-helix protein